MEQNSRLSDSSFSILAPSDYFPQDTLTVSHLEQLLAGTLINVVFLPQVLEKNATITFAMLTRFVMCNRMACTHCISENEVPTIKGDVKRIPLNFH